MLKIPEILRGTEVFPFLEWFLKFDFNSLPNGERIAVAIFLNQPFIIELIDEYFDEGTMLNDVDYESKTLNDFIISYYKLFLKEKLLWKK